jgi:hypothetical protein
MLLACVAAVLLIACTNVANLQFAPTVTREPEMALRSALGAGRLCLIRQSLVENLTLSAIASVLGLTIAIAVTWLIRHGSLPGDFSSGSSVSDLLRAPFGKLSAAVDVNIWALAFTAGIALLTTILFRLAPAMRSSRIDLRTSRQGAARGVSSGRPQQRLRSALLVPEIGLVVLLLTGARLLIRSFAHVLQNGAGFDPRQCLTAELQRNNSAALAVWRFTRRRALPLSALSPSPSVWRTMGFLVSIAGANCKARPHSAFFDCGIRPNRRNFCFSASRFEGPRLFASENPTGLFRGVRRLIA